MTFLNTVLMFLGHAIITGDSNQTLDNRDLDMMREKNHSITFVHCLVRRYHPGSIDTLMFLVEVDYDDKLLFLAIQKLIQQGNQMLRGS